MTTAGLVVWVTGRPQAGKSTFAVRLAERLRQQGVATALLDGDETRGSLVPTPGYEPADRENFYATLTNLAWQLARQGLVVVVPATAHQAQLRERARAVEPTRFFLVYVDAPLEICMERDRKGLYEGARSGALRNLPAVDSAYEPPTTPNLYASGGHDDAALSQASSWVVSQRPLSGSDPS